MSLSPFASASERIDLASAARTLLGSGQGVYVEAEDGSTLLAQAADRAVHPASISKVPTTLALLRRLGPDYRFVTTLATTGARVGDRVEGDLWIDDRGDPALVDEDALLIAKRLNELGIRRVVGDLRVNGALMFDWQIDPTGAHLRAALTGRVSPDAWTAVRALGQSTGAVHDPTVLSKASALPAVTFEPPAPSARSGPGVMQPLLVHHSEPLLPMVKALNDFSNNVFNVLAASVGGADEIERVARAAVPPAVRAEIVLRDAAGADARNRLSPRAAVKLLRALERQLQSGGYRLTDALPVAGIDPGTLHDRLNEPDESGLVVGKTGTYGDYGASALIGAVRSADHGMVYFAILNHGVPVREARRRQDRFVRQLLRTFSARPWSYERDPRPAIAQVQILAPPS